MNRIALLVSAALALLSACATMPRSLPPPGPAPKPVAAAGNPIHTVRDAMRLGLSGATSGSCRHEVSIETTGEAKIRDLAPLLYAQGIAFVYGDSGGRPVYLPRWSGSVCRFGAMLAGYIQGSWSWDGRTLTIGSKREVTGYIPASLVQVVKKDLSALAIPVKVSVLGVFSGDLNRSEYDALKAYFARLRSGVALVTLQVAAVSLHESYDRGGGFDWQAFAAALGSPGLLETAGGAAAAVAGVPVSGAAPLYGPSYGGGSPYGSPYGASTVAPAGTKAAAGGLLSFKDGKLSISARSPSVSVASVIDLLSTYGRIALLQNASIEALSGTSVELKSVTNTPYVSGVGIGGYGAGYGGVYGGGGRAYGGLGLANTSTATAGLTLKITPSYSPGQSFVTIRIMASLDSVQQFVNLSAGNQIGSFTQPVTQQQSLNSSVAVPAGEPAVIGGLVYTSRNTQQSAPNGLYGLAGKSIKQTRDRLFIIVRPTVTIYRPAG